jgi:thioredoxin reductase (NADPH)
MTKNTVDLAIVGGGPVGLFAAYYSGLRQLSCSIIESLPALGGRLVSVFPEKHIYDVPGFPKIRARDLAANLIEQAKQSSPSLFLSETVESIEPSGSLFHLKTSKGNHLARAVLIVGGIGVSSPQKHTAPGASALEGKGIDYIVTNPAHYQNKHVVIAGGGDSAVDWAQELLGVAASVTLVHRTARFRAHEKNVATLKASGAHIITDAEIVAFEGASHLKKVVIRQKQNPNEDIVCSADNALIMFGFRTDIGFMKNWGIELTPDEDQVVVDSAMRTSQAGIYAAGDIAWHDSKIALIATGFGEAAIAVNHIKTHLDPSEDLQPLYSTSIMEK